MVIEYEEFFHEMVDSAEINKKDKKICEKVYMNNTEGSISTNKNGQHGEREKGKNKKHVVRERKTERKIDR